MHPDGEYPAPGAPVQRAFFYGLWPRFTEDQPERDDADAGAAATPAADA